MRIEVNMVVLVGLLLTAAVLVSPAAAEPYLAVESGLKCATCHVNPSGGGKRTPFGMLYARNQIAARALTLEPTRAPWTGEVKSWLAVGADVRGGYADVDVPGVAAQSDFDLARASVYAHFRAIPNLLSFYFDQKIAPDNSDEREAYLLLTPAAGKYTLKVGQMFLPFGLRLEDDETFVRQASGINFNTPDDGLEFGLELPKWSAQLAVTDGAAEVAGSDDQLSLSAAYVLQRWRVGANYNSSEDAIGDRRMYGLFAGLRTGPVAWLAEVDLVEDDAVSGSRRSYASLVEGNWRLRKGHNLKFGYEFLEPDRDRGEDQQERYSFVWEYSPLQFVQSRLGVRRYNGIPNFPVSNRDELFAELHVYF